MSNLRSGLAAAGNRRPAGYWTDLAFGRALPGVLFSVLLVAKLLMAGQSLEKVARLGGRAGLEVWFTAINQVLTVVYIALVIFLFTVRLRRRSGLRRPLVVVVAFFGTFCLLLATVLTGSPPRLYLIFPSLVLSTIGLVYTLWALAWLGRSFSIMPEARRLVSSGPYALSRHPLYLGEGVVSVSLLLPTIALPGALLLILFLGAQYLRINWEEEVLSSEFSADYAAYSRRVPRYIPWPWLLRP